LNQEVCDYKRHIFCAEVRKLINF